MTSPAVFTTAPPSSTINNRAIAPLSSNYSPKLRKNTNKRSNYLLQRIKSSQSDSVSTIAGLNGAGEEEDEDPVKIGARVRVTVPLKVYHVPKVSEVELNGKEGKVKENVAVWRGKSISANLPYKIEFFEKLEGRGDAPVKFVAHLKEDEFDCIE
ncbi:putative ferredoxin:thioredoxin reductase [Helianthus annuus]|nr:putative ferredoxin:thioredoxin reductase [Helianthus annuus]KAJ0448920.1 putative ferredoxin:thioredoxin reductase [Helianthus annuus]KAJ0633793.1 putative ferredoxin:thioredoxin reductase [Helianthus annuus]KAJ0669049.1 putative ferredoxin:thioredoxin reductase [Helianthus annuus]KAJ0814778.1 putative ferredoxin:thioredoxin reductase [Helianthus annuus]